MPGRGNGGRCGGRVVLPLGTLSLLETVAVLSG